MLNSSFSPYYKKFNKYTFDYVKYCIDQNETEISVGTIYETPHFTGYNCLSFINESLGHFMRVPTNVMYYYSQYSTTYFISILKCLITTNNISFFRKSNKYENMNLVYLGFFGGIANDQISLNGKEVFFQKAIYTQPILSFKIGICSSITILPIVLFHKKSRKLNTGKLSISIENKFGPYFSLRMFNPLIKQCYEIYGLEFEPEDLDKQVKIFNLISWWLYTAISIRYCFITLKIGNTSSYNKLSEVQYIQNINYLINPKRREYEEAAFNSKEEAFNHMKNYQNIMSVFYKLEDLTEEMIFLLSEKIKFALEISIQADINDIIDIVKTIRKK